MDRTTREGLMRAAISFLLAVITSFVIFSVIKSSMEKNEQHECRVWQQQAEDYPLFYQTGWQKEQCDHHGIIINAPVK